jgi:hypothetical protein
VSGSSDELPLVVADAHVHIYDCFDLPRFLHAAAAHFAVEARRQGASRHRGVLLLTESQGHDWFAQLAERGRLERAGASAPWRVERTEEPESLHLVAGVSELWLVAGRQVVAREDLEVLALATARRFPDGAPFEATVEGVRSSGAIAVVPWGFGKWWGRRGALLRRVLSDPRFSGLHVGDNSARPAFWRRPIHFELATAGGGRILPGSDPLPFPSESRRPGSVGFTLRAVLDPRRPAQQLRELAARPDFAPRPYGPRETPARFFRNQLAMQMRKRGRAA